jgi:hypothetical protein
LRQDEEREQERRGEKKQNRGDPIFPRFRRQQKCGDSKQEPTAKVKETKIVRDNERDSKYGRSDNDTDPECHESYLPARAMCWY